MQLSCLQENLERALNIVRPAIASRSPLPIVQHVLLEAREGMLRLTATDLNLTIITHCGAMIEEEGAVTLPHRLFHDLVKSLPSDRLDLGVKQDQESETNVNIACGRSVTNINGALAKDYPAVGRSLEDAVTITMQSSELSRAIGLVRYCAAADESRPVLTGVLVAFKDETVRFGAADGFRMSLYDLDLPEPVSDASVIIPASAMREIQRLAGEQNGPVPISVTQDGSAIHFGFGHTELFSQLISGKFPNVDHLVPERYETRIVLDREDLTRHVQIASVMARDNNQNIIRLVAETGDDNPGEMTVSSNSPEQGDTCSAFAVKELEGESNKIALNHRYLAEFLAANKGDICIKMVNPSSPVLFETVGDEHCQYVVMPMYVQW